MHLNRLLLASHSIRGISDATEDPKAKGHAVDQWHLIVSVTASVIDVRCVLCFGAIHSLILFVLSLFSCRRGELPCYMRRETISSHRRISMALPLFWIITFGSSHHRTVYGNGARRQAMMDRIGSKPLNVAGYTAMGDSWQ